MTPSSEMNRLDLMEPIDETPCSAGRAARCGCCHPVCRTATGWIDMTSKNVPDVSSAESGTACGELAAGHSDERIQRIRVGQRVPADGAIWVDACEDPFHRHLAFLAVEGARQTSTAMNWSGTCRGESS